MSTTCFSPQFAPCTSKLGLHLDPSITCDCGEKYKGNHATIDDVKDGEEPMEAKEMG